MLISFLEDDTGEGFFGNGNRRTTSPKNRCVALHFPAAVSGGTAEASRSKSSVITKLVVASSLPPDLLSPFEISIYKSGHLELKKKME